MTTFVEKKLLHLYSCILVFSLFQCFGVIFSFFHQVYWTLSKLRPVLICTIFRLRPRKYWNSPIFFCKVPPRSHCPVPELNLDNTRPFPNASESFTVITVQICCSGASTLLATVLLRWSTRNENDYLSRSPYCITLTSLWHKVEIEMSVFSYI